MKLVNLTSHPIIVHDGDRVAVRVEPAGVVARVREVQGTPDFLSTQQGLVSVTPIWYAPEVDGLPDPEPGVWYIVSRITAAAVDRDDLLFPGNELRDPEGQIVGCRTLGTFHHSTNRSDDLV